MNFVFIFSVFPSQSMAGEERQSTIYFVVYYNIVCKHTIKIINDNTSSINIVLPYIRLAKYDNEIIDDFISSLELDTSSLSELEDLGLIEYNSSGFAYKTNQLEINYFDDVILVCAGENQNCIVTGNYRYTRYGKQLAEILYKNMEQGKDMRYIPFLREYLSK